MDFSIGQCFQILSVAEDAPLEEVKASYRDLAAVWHPDRFAGNPRLEKKATEKLQEINAAYETLLKFYEEQARAVSVAASQADEAEPPFVNPEPPAPSTGEARPRVAFVFVCAVLAALVAAALAAWLVPGLRSRWLPPRAAAPGTEARLPKVFEPAPKEPSEGKKAAAQKLPARPNRIAPPVTAVPREGYFTLGATKDEVRAAQGAATQVSETRWAYGSSYVDFTGGKVTGWHSSSLDPLRVRMEAPSGTAGEGRFTVGSTKDEVVASQGTPDKVSGESWGYGFSSVRFEKGRVAGWYSSSVEPLQVRMTPSAASGKGWFTVGASKDEVLAVEGTPTQLSENRWGYGFSYVEFERGKVTRWYSSEQRPLHTEEEP